jgi:hypothetical protein
MARCRHHQLAHRADHLKAMQRLSREVLFTTLAGTQRRKRLSKKILGIT